MKPKRRASQLPQRESFASWDSWRAAIEQHFLERGDVANALRALVLMPTDPLPTDWR